MFLIHRLYLGTCLSLTRFILMNVCVKLGFKIMKIKKTVFSALGAKKQLNSLEKKLTCLVHAELPYKSTQFKTGLV